MFLSAGFSSPGRASDRMPLFLRYRTCCGRLPASLRGKFSRGRRVEGHCLILRCGALLHLRGGAAGRSEPWWEDVRMGRDGVTCYRYIASWRLPALCCAIPAGASHYPSCPVNVLFNALV